MGALTYVIVRTCIKPKMKKEVEQAQEKTKEKTLKRTVTPEKKKKRKMRWQSGIPKKYQMIIQTTNYNTVVDKDGNEVLEKQWIYVPRLARDEGEASAES